MSNLKKKTPEKVDLNDPESWKDWALDEFPLLSRDDWNVVRQTGKYQGSTAKAEALLTLSGSAGKEGEMM